MACLTTDGALYEYKAWKEIQRTDCSARYKVCQTHVLLTNDASRVLDDPETMDCENQTRFFPCD